MPRVQGRTGAACAPHREFRCGVPSLGAWLRRFAQGTGPCAWGERGLAALRSPCSRLQVLCLPSVASPFARMTVRWTVIFIRAHPPPYEGSFIQIRPKDTCLEQTDALQYARSGAAPGTVRLKGTERKATPDFRAGRQLCREYTTAWTQEVGQRREQLPRGAQEQPAPRMYTPHAGFPRSALVSDGPRKGLFSLLLSVPCSKDRCAPSVVRPLAGAGIHWIPAYYPARPWPWPGRARSVSRPFGRVLRLRASLGLSKGD